MKAKKIVFCFAGTGEGKDKELDNYVNWLEGNNKFKNDVIRVYIRGCEHKNVGGRSISPDLSIVTAKIGNAFNGKSINLELLQEELGSAIYDIKGPAETKGDIPIS